MIFKLSKPLTTQMGQTYTELNLDLDSLTGDDILSIEQELANGGNPFIASIDISRAYYARLAARACGISHFELKKLSVKDFNHLMREVSNFLYSSDSQEDVVPMDTVETEPEAVVESVGK